MTSQLTLIELLREQKKKKNRPLKVVCDWDECLQVLKPALIYELFKGPKTEFKQFWREFWEGVDMTAGSVGSKINDYRGRWANEVKQAIKEQKKILEESRDWNLQEGSQTDNFYISPRRFEAPFLTTADGIVEGYKEGYIDKLVIISSYLSRKNGIDVTGKREKAKKTFGKFPNVEVSLNYVEKGSDGRLRPHRWEVIRDKFPDFDIYIDDNPSLVANSSSTLKYMNQIPGIKDKVFALNNYKSNLKVTGPNIYHFKTEVSDLKDEDFAKAAQEMKDKKDRKWKETLEKQKDYHQPWIIYGILVGIVLALLFVLYAAVRRMGRKKK